MRDLEQVAMTALWRDNKLVLQRRVTVLAGRLGFFGGKIDIESGETQPEAAIRELREELGLELELEDIGNEVAVVKTDQYEGHVFEYRLPQDIVLIALEGHLVERTLEELLEAGNKHGLADLTRLAVLEFTRRQ